MFRPRKAIGAVIAVGLIILAAATVWVLLMVTGPALPAGATRLHVATEPPNLSFSCMTAALAPVRVTSSGDELVLVSVTSGDTVTVVWPSGFAAWKVGGRAVVADPWGSVVALEGDVLDSLGGGIGTDDAFHICPFGIPARA